MCGLSLSECSGYTGRCARFKRLPFHWRRRRRHRWLLSDEPRKQSCIANVKPASRHKQTISALGDASGRRTTNERRTPQTRAATDIVVGSANWCRSGPLPACLFAASTAAAAGGARISIFNLSQSTETRTIRASTNHQQNNNSHDHVGCKFMAPPDIASGGAPSMSHLCH